MGPNTLLCEVIDPMPALKRPIDAIKEVWMAKPIARCYQTLGRPARILSSIRIGISSIVDRVRSRAKHAP